MAAESTVETIITGGLIQGVAGAGTVHVGIMNFYGRPAEQPAPASADAGPIPPCPYPGLAYFGPDEADLFFGRNTTIERLSEAVSRQSLTALVGASGTGKSSVVLAGLAPHLHCTGNWLFSYFRIGTDLDHNPFLALARALVPLYVASDDATERLKNTKKLASSLQTGELTLRDVFADCRRRNKGQRILLIADQFEEVFTKVEDDVLRQHFINVLLTGFSDLLPGSNHPGVSLILTLRADFYGRALDVRVLADALQDHVENLGPMIRDELEAAIVRPAEKASISFEPGLVPTLLDEVGGKLGSLPLLQFALREMWSRQEKRQITRRCYDEIGGVKAALAKRAEAIFAELTKNGTDARLETAFRRLFTRLVALGEGQEDTRRLVERQELGDEAWALAQRLADEANRLVVTNVSASARETAEVVHEALIRHWPRLVCWIDQDRAFQSWLRQIRPQFEEWRKYPDDDGTLLRGGPLAAGEEWLGYRGAEFGDEERGYVELSRRKRDDAAAREQQRQQALRVSESLRLSVEARQALGPEPETSLRVAWEAVLWDRNEVSETVFREALKRMPASVQLLCPGDSSVGRMTMGYGTDGSFVYTVSEHGTSWNQGRVETWRSNGPRIGRFDLSGTGRWAVAAAPDRQALLVGRDGRISLLDLTGRLLAAIALPNWSADENAKYFTHDRRLIASPGGVGLFQHGAWAWLFEVSPISGKLILLRTFQIIADRSQDDDGLHWPFGTIWDIALDVHGRRILSNADDGTARCWNFEGGLLGTLECDDGSKFTSAEFLADERVVTGSMRGKGQIWAIDGRLLTEFKSNSGRDLFVKAVDASGRYFVTASNTAEHALEVWDADGQRQAELAAREKHYWCAMFSPDGRFVAAGCADGAVRVWDWREQRLAFELHGHADTVSILVFDPGDGQSLLSADHRRSVRLWSLATPVLPTLRGHAGALRNMVRLDDRLLTCGAYDDKTLLWGTQSVPAVLAGTLIEIASGPAIPNVVLTNDRSGNVRLWGGNGTLGSFDCRCVVPRASRGGERVDIAAVSPDGSRFALAYDQASGRAAELWSVEGDFLATLVGRSAPDLESERVRIRGLGFQAGTSMVVTGAENGMIWLWSAEGQPVGDFVADDASPDRLFDLAVDPLGEFILVGVRNEAKLWNWRGKPIGHLATLGYKVHRVTISPNGARLFTISDNPSGQPSYYAQLWDRQGRQLANLDAPGVSVSSLVHFDAAGRYLMLRNASDVRIYDANGELIGVLAAAHGINWTDVAVSPDGGDIAAVFSDGIVRIWRYAERRRAFSIPAGSTGPIGFSSDGGRLLVATSSGSIEQQPLDVSELFAGATARLTRGFSLDEVRRFAIQQPAKLKLTY